jgi:NAD(P)-dependent dehydrogenase (short-subunit alcohol dehydrogenase family)
MSDPIINPLSLAGSRILVTGASSGIGENIAITLSRLGAAVICVGRDKSRLQSTYDKLHGAGHKIEVFDLTVIDEIPEWVASLAPLHGLVHAAGVQMLLPLRATTSEKWHHVFRLNTEAAYALIRGFDRQKKFSEGKGSIVLISSVMGLVGAPGRSAYSASKSSLQGIAQSLALELAPAKIRVNCVAPAYVKTPMWDDLIRLMTPEQVQIIEAKHPLGIGNPDDVAYAVAYLLAETGRWVTGTTLVVDGGYTAA